MGGRWAGWVVVMAVWPGPATWNKREQGNMMGTANTGEVADMACHPLDCLPASTRKMCVVTLAGHTCGSFPASRDAMTLLPPPRATPSVGHSLTVSPEEVKDV